MNIRKSKRILKIIEENKTDIGEYKGEEVRE